MLREVCSEALAEHRGVYRKISERTIRDDLRVMRSDILGFNAPIVFEGGYYTYSDPGYSIFNVSITEMNLLKEVFSVILEVKDKNNGSAFLDVLAKLSDITGLDLPKDIEQQINQETLDLPYTGDMSDWRKELKSEDDWVNIFDKEEQQLIMPSEKAGFKFGWRKVLDLI
jgi:hypothetical protein